MLLRYILDILDTIIKTICNVVVVIFWRKFYFEHEITVRDYNHKIILSSGDFAFWDEFVPDLIFITVNMSSSSTKKKGLKNEGLNHCQLTFKNAMENDFDIFLRPTSFSLSW